MTDEEINLMKDYADVFGTAAGKRVLEDIMNFSGILRPTSSLDHTSMVLERGKQMLAYRIIDFSTNSEMFKRALFEKYQKAYMKQNED